MKNLFDYAPKELTQDGFIRWLWANYKEPELKDLVWDFVLFLSNQRVDIRDPEFRYLKTWAQVSHMDLGCDFFYAEDDKVSRYCLVIEDKTTSWEHNQLETYNKVLERWDPQQKGRIIKVFYKTSPSDAAETARVIKAGWRMIELKEIVTFWKRYTSHPNLIVSSYAKHIVKIGESSETVTMPKTNDIIAWGSYFEKTLLPRLNKDIETAEFHVGTTHYGYKFINVYPKGRCDNLTPYLEIRSRDIFDGRFVARILKYGKDIDAESLDALRLIISRNGDGIFKANWGGKRTQQAGTTAIRESRLSSKTEEELIASIESATHTYLKILDLWNNQAKN